MTGSLQIDLTTPVPPAAAAPYGPGTTSDPQGHTITADQRSLFLDGTPWMPVVGEFHFSRYPRDEWADALLKIKAGGVDVVSTYVFWIHHEEQCATFDWSGQRSLRSFLQMADRAGLRVIVRMGPWCHGEVRNGGFPDWVQHSGANLGSTDESFMELVRPFFAEQAKQMEGLLWKDGGPVIGIQVDNECDQAEYLLALKALARTCGVDVPLYTITGWQGGLPEAELIPVFGGYVDGFWADSIEEFRKEFIFTTVRAMNDLGAQLDNHGAQLDNEEPVDSAVSDQFPYACAEIGGGMMSSYDHRIKVDPHGLASLALTKLGNGNNMPGYYMYHGGINPAGALSFLHEDTPNRMPVKDYDFQAPLGMTGLARPHYYLFRQQHHLLRQWGAALARMTVFLPEVVPIDPHDVQTLRWSVRSDGWSGFLFFNNQQPYEPLPEHADVQFALNTARGAQLVPRQPLTVPTGSYGIWPVNLDCDGVSLDYATVQPLHRLRDEDGTPVHFFAALANVRPELCLGGEVLPVTAPGPQVAAEVSSGAGLAVRFVVLTPVQAQRFGTVWCGGRERVILTEALVLQDASGFRLQTDEPEKASFALFPPLASVRIDGTDVAEVRDGAFSAFDPRPDLPAPVTVGTTLERPAGPRGRSFTGSDEQAWEEAASHRVDIPAAAVDRRLQLNFHYTGNAARLYAGEELVMDSYYNGDPMSVALWRIPAADRSRLSFRVMPYADHVYDRLPGQARKAVDTAMSSGTLDEVRVTCTHHLELGIADVENPQPFDVENP